MFFAATEHINYCNHQKRYAIFHRHRAAARSANPPEKTAELLDEMQKEFSHLEDARKELEASEPIPFEEYIRLEQHVHVVTQENKDRYQKQYKRYLSIMQRREEAAMTRMSTVRQRLREVVRRAQELAGEQEIRMQSLARTLGSLVDVLQTTQRGLDYPPKQLTLEHLGNIDHELARHEWLKKQ